MKKFTLFAAVAALTVSSAFAATPQKSFAAKAEQVKAELTAINTEARVANSVSLDNSIDATEGEDVTVDMNVLYAPAHNSFYMGISPTFSGYNVLLGLTGIRGELPFYNLTQGADAFSWEFAKEAGQDDAGNVLYDYYTSTETHGFMPLTPASAYIFPKLTATFGTDEAEYEDPNGYYYFTGGSYADWGFHKITDPENYDYTSLFGAYPCAAPLGFTRFPEYNIVRPGATEYNAEKYNEFGSSVNWADGYSSETETVSDVKITAFGTLIPAMPSAYQINSTWSYIYNIEATEQVTVPVVVYAANDKGQVDYNTIIGKGEFNFEAGQTQFDVLPGAPIYAVDADGYEIDAPACVPAGQPVMVCYEGLDNPSILAFEMVSNGETSFKVEDRANASYLFPNHAYTFVDCTVTTEGQEPQEVSASLSAPYLYYADATRTSLITPSDFAMFFDVNFPLVINPADNTADFTVEVPAEGGEVVVPVYCDYMIDALIEEQLVTVTTSDFVTATQAFDAENSMTNVTITVAANTAAEARKGYVVYEGFGIDFYITVKQAASEESGINSVVVKPVAKGTKFFDLQGRQLQAAPAAGMYIENVNGVATKQIAR